MRLALSVVLSCHVQIYNEALYDLLDITTQPHEISIYENSRGVVTLSGLRTAVVNSEAEALALLFEVGRVHSGDAEERFRCAAFK